MKVFRWARAFSLGFYGSVIFWTAGLVGLAVTRHLLTGIHQQGDWSPSRVLFLLPGWIGFLLPFTTYAAGIAGQGKLSVGGLIRRAAPIVAASYLLIAFASPVALYREHERWAGNLETVYPFGPRTPGGILAHRHAIEANPPETFSFRSVPPMALPPNWLTYLLQSSAAAAAFAMLSALIGFWGAIVTTGLSPPNRRNARWALGLGSGILFFAALVAGSEWVRSNPENSGVLGAWLPLLVPLTELVLLIWVSRARPIPSNDRRITWGR